jgi:hypothetical protein
MASHALSLPYLTMETHVQPKGRPRHICGKQNKGLGEAYLGELQFSSATYVSTDVPHALQKLR